MTMYRTQFTYGAASGAFTPAATPQDVFMITGSATSNVYVLKMGISTTQTTAGTNEWYLLKLSAPDTGGTTGAIAAVPFDSQNPASSVSLAAYTAAPTGGTVVGPIWDGFVDSAAPATAGVGNVVVEVNFADMFGQPLSLLSASEALVWNFNGAALPTGLSVCAYCVWYELPKT